MSRFTEQITSLVYEAGTWDIIHHKPNIKMRYTIKKTGDVLLEFLSKDGDVTDQDRGKASEDQVEKLLEEIEMLLHSFTGIDASEDHSYGVLRIEHLAGEMCLPDGLHDAENYLGNIVASFIEKVE